jgi:recombination protein RecA
MLEMAIGRPGYPAGKIIELYGEPHCGKTTLAYHAIAATQRLNPDALAFFIDTEQSFDPERAAQCGVDVTRCKVDSAKTIESVIRLMEKYFDLFLTLPERPPIIFVIDSITGVSTEYDLGKEFVAEQRTGHEAKQIRAGLKRINGQLAELKIPCIMVNHVMANVPKKFGRVKATQSSGGKSPKYFAAVRIEVKRTGDVTRVHKGYKIKTAQETAIKIDKSKVASPRIQQISDLLLTNEKGFDHTDNLLEALRFVDAVTETTKGKVYKFGEEQFRKEEWPRFMEQNGGYEVFVKVMREKAIETGWMKPYGTGKME